MGKTSDLGLHPFTLYQFDLTELHSRIHINMLQAVEGVAFGRFQNFYPNIILKMLAKACCLTGLFTGNYSASLYRRKNCITNPLPEAGPPRNLLPQFFHQAINSKK